MRCRNAFLVVVLTMWAGGVSLAPAGQVVVIRGTGSTPNASERSFARTVARGLARRLDEMGVPHVVLDDEAVTASSLKGVSVAVLPYNPRLPGKERAALEKFTARGGKLIVFYSADPALASLMSLTLGPYKASHENPWVSMSFEGDVLPYAPREIRQRSRNIRPVYPVGRGATTIALWRRSTGTAAADPACVRSPTGFWVTHVLLDDGDTESKKRLLLAMLGDLDPSLWPAAAAHSLRTCTRIGRADTLEDAEALVTRLAGTSPGREKALAFLARAGARYRRARQLHSTGRHAEAVESSAGVRQFLLEAYGAAQRSRAGERRGVWEQTGAGLYPGDWDRSCALLAKHGVTDLFLNVAWPGMAHYKGREAEGSRVFKAHGDQLEQGLRAAGRHGIRVHAWKVCWNLDRASPELIERFRREGRLQVSSKGAAVSWLCPSRDENLRYEKDAIRDLLRRYPVHGIHLDYIRYRDSHVCYCGECRRRFEEARGRPVAGWPDDAVWGPLGSEYRDWRLTMITRLVRDVRAIADRVDRPVAVSASVYGKYPQCSRSVGQDWGDWIRKGYVDFVCPMNYTADLDSFAALTRSQVSLPGASNRVWPGIGVTASESRLDPVQVVDQVVALRSAGARGFVLYDFDRVLADDVLPVLSLGLTADGVGRKTEHRTSNIER
ncbi:MAG: family 10 glycosylhydrolase [Lentisphaerae bacterium]|nr:family 10 glycosylhydrolase [Lentisphaerota bacterium]